tara:strand:+ start:398 stop:1960 length:1563 start_codon:yes stop_codon:yes gene_type:complete
MAVQFLSSITISGSTSVSTIGNDNATYTGILVWDGSSLKYRTKAQLKSDIGAGSGAGSVTSVTVEGTTGLSGSGTVTSSGTITLTNSDRGSSQAIYKNIATQSGTATANSNNDTLTITGTGGTTTSRVGDTITINSTDNNDNYYVTSASFATSNGVLTLNRNGGLAAVTVDLDGRYVTSSGVTSIATTNGITGGTITGTGTIELDSTVVRTTGTQSIGGVKTFTSNTTFNGYLRGSGQQLILNAGESYSYATGQTAEIIYLNAESGIQINSSPDNWSSGWAGRKTTTINDTNGNSTFANDITVSGGDITLGGTGRIQGVDTVSAGTDATSKTYVDNAISNHRPSDPAKPSSAVANIVGETIEILFGKSGTNNIDYYQVWSSDDGGDFGIIGQIPPDDFAATMTIVDTTFDTGGTMSYRIYAVKEGIYSDPATVSKVFTVGALSVSNMTVINLNTAYYVQYEKPVTRFIDHIEIYMDSQTTTAALSRSNASIIYSGDNASYMYNAATSRNYHQFWVEVVTS